MYTQDPDLDSLAPSLPRRIHLLRNTRMTLIQVLLSTALFSTIIWFVQTTYSAIADSAIARPLHPALRLNESVALAILRVLQGLLTLLSTSALLAGFELVQWCLSARLDGLSYATFLVLSPATFIWGTLRLLFTRGVDGSVRGWAFLKVLFTTMIWLAALLLFLNTSIVTVYDTNFSYNVTAGVGPFNASLVSPFFTNLASLAPNYPFRVLPYSYLVTARNLVVNPTYATTSAPVRPCDPSADCDGYLLSGGIMMTTPWVPSGITTRPVVRVDAVPAVQLDFAPGPMQHEFTDDECETYGTRGVLIAVQMCVKNGGPTPGSVVAGLYVCRNGIDTTTSPSTCRATSPTPNITAILTAYTRRATIVTTTTNYSIISTSDISSPVPVQPFDLTAYRGVLAWLLDYNATDIPAPSSITQDFWSSADQLMDPLSSAILKQNFHSLLAFPFWLFNENNYGNIALQSQEVIDTLSPEFYTTAHIVTPYRKLQLDRSMLVSFIALEGVVLLFMWAVLICVWVTGPRLPAISSYTLFDASFKLRTGIDMLQHKVTEADDGYILQLVGGSKAYSRA